MKIDEKRRALHLRKTGASIKEIARLLSVSKSSVSTWVRDVELSVDQRKELSERGKSIEVIEKNRISRINNTLARRAAILKNAGNDISSINTQELWLLGIALYWGEGGKTSSGSVRVSNSDPGIIHLMMRFFREVCKVPEEEFRGHVHTFSHLNADSAEQYWSSISGIRRENFYRAYVKKSVASKHKRDTLPHGTFQIYVSDTKLFFTIIGWIERVKVLTKISQ